MAYSRLFVRAVADCNVHVRDLVELQDMAERNEYPWTQYCEDTLNRLMADWIERNPRLATVLKGRFQ